MFYRAEFDEDDKDNEYVRISVVNDPAIEQKGVLLKKDIEDKRINLNKHFISLEKQVLAGPALVADKWIYRKDPITGSEYYLMFTKEDIRKYAEKFVEVGKVINFEHEDRLLSSEVREVIIVNEDKSNISEYTKDQDFDVQEGDLFLVTHFPKKDEWDLIKKGEHNGYSIEGWFEHKEIKFKKQVEKNKTRNMKIEELLEKISETVDSKISEKFASFNKKEDEEVEASKNEEKEDEKSEMESDEDEKEDKVENSEEEKEDYEKEDEKEDEKSEMEEDDVAENDEEVFKFTEEMYESLLNKIVDLEEKIAEKNDEESEEEMNKENLTSNKKEDKKQDKRLSKFNHILSK